MDRNLQHFYKKEVLVKYFKEKELIIIAVYVHCG